MLTRSRQFHIRMLCPYGRWLVDSIFDSLSKLKSSVLAQLDLREQLHIIQILLQNLGMRDETNLPATEIKHVRAVAVAALFGTLQSWTWAGINIYQDYLLMSLEFVVVGLGFLLVQFVNRRGHLMVAANILCFLLLLQSGFGQFVFGYDSGSWVYFAISILVAFLIFPRRRLDLAFLFATLYGLSLVAVMIWRDDLPVRFITSDPHLSLILNVSMMCLLLAGLAAVFVGIVNRSEDALAEVHKQANDLLLNAIPEVIAERLKDNPEQMIADRHADVSIMFADVAGFTNLSANQDPAETVNMLNTLFSEFDDVCDAAGIEKIRTIGDGYMVVGGAPQPLDDHPVKMIEAAQKFLSIAHRHNIDIRIGINSGEVVAGIVGLRRFHYDVWGDAVNVAARMETTGEVGKIHISSSFAERLGDKFPLKKRDPINIKGKGIMQTWFVDAGAD